MKFKKSCTQFLLAFLCIYLTKLNAFRLTTKALKIDIFTNKKLLNKNQNNHSSKLFAASQNTWGNIFEKLEQFLSPKSVVDNAKSNLEPKIDLSIYDADINNAELILQKAATDKKVNSDEVIDQLLSLEKLMRKKNKLDEGVTSKETIQKLNGAWRLIFTTGTVDTQKKIGKINYFPIKAVQSFDTVNKVISNGIYIGSYAVLRFVGDFEWIEKLRKLEFDFNEVYVFGLKISIKKGDAVKIGQQTGLGSDRSAENSKTNERKAMFMWISANDEIATARGGGGGLALWKRDLEMQSLLI